MRNPFELLEDRRINRDKERLLLNKRLSELALEGERDQVTLHTLRAMYPNGWEGDVLAREQPAKQLSAMEMLPPSVVAAVQRKAEGMGVKDIALAILKDAFPEGLTATQIKAKAQLRYRRDLNSNTLTVSLVRASKPSLIGLQKCVWRERKWFYIRSDNGSAANVRQLPLDPGAGG